MAEPLKNMYNPLFFERLCGVLKSVIPGFNDMDFVHDVFNRAWPDMELKQRMRHITLCLHKFFPADFAQAAPLLIKLIKTFRKSEVREQGFELIFLADYIEVYGLDHFDEAVEAIEEVTKLVSAEFAVRPFLIKYPEKMMLQMRTWSKHAEANVRRLATEGCRPRLPWAAGVPYLKKDPSAILPILENLKTDPSEYVRRSVANNLNDIAKDHPTIVMQLVKSWYGKNELTDKIIKHGCRSLLKKGNTDMLHLHGFDPKSKLQVEDFRLSNKKVKIGDGLSFQFNFKNKEKKPARFRIEYAIDYLTSTGKTSRKIFKINENLFEPSKAVVFNRKQTFQNLTTRKHYKGKHRISIIVNGKNYAEQEFMVQ